jgi:Rhodanese-related sulfurtransferase
MGPLVPEIVGNELNYIMALLIGFAFGFVLEQAGFSSTRKLAGVFYGYDFVVLRVFFTAAVTAMIGVIVFAHYGLLDIELIYINPTFLWPAIVGGVIMGGGFILGGYCPGTSMCGAAIGKIDAMIFVAGSFFGVLVFAEGYPVFESLYKSSNFGSPKVFESLSMPQGVFALILTVVAVSAFWITAFIEKKVNKGVITDFTPKRIYVTVSIVVILLSVWTIFLPDRKTSFLTKANDTGFINSQDIQFMTSDELAFRIIDEDPRLQLVDVRSEKEFNMLTLPKAVNILAENMFGKDNAILLSDKWKKKVYFSDDETQAKKAAALASLLGFENNYVLKGGLNEFKNSIINFKRPDVINTRAEADEYRFREKASLLVPELIKKSKTTVTVKKVVKKITGGC